ncbi:MAG: hypothetical protein J5532_02485 [Lachnospiraceae bacterium]|nr:hypothetical protein [Lachnospiraceae bacterium]
MDYFQLENNRCQLFALLTEQKSMLEQLISDLKVKTRNRPYGQLRSSFCGIYPQYYIKPGRDKPWQYLSKSERPRAVKIANYEYRKALLRRAEHDLKAIERLLSDGISDKYDENFSNLPPGRRLLVDKLYETDEEFVNGFLSEDFDSYQSFAENKRFDTAQGESVRSKAEWIIAESLARHEIPYQYEYPLYLDGLGIVHPDFRCLNVRTRRIVFWEHLGLMGDPEYATQAIRKLRFYESNGLLVGENLIVTEETQAIPLRPETINHWIERLLL